MIGKCLPALKVKGALVYFENILMKKKYDSAPVAMSSTELQLALFGYVDVLGTCFECDTFHIHWLL